MRPGVAFTLWNRSQFEVKAVYAHAGPEPVMESDLLEGQGLVPEQARTVTLEGGPYFTAVRPRVDGASDLAVTTEEPLEVDGPGYTLVIFDVSFRLLRPGSPDNPFADARPDAGSEG